MCFRPAVVVFVTIVMLLVANMSIAGIWIHPTAMTDTFTVNGAFQFQMLAGPSAGSSTTFSGAGSTTLAHDSLSSAFVHDGLDTINTEVVSVDLVGTALGYNAELIAGQGKSFSGFLGIPQPTPGQVQVLAGPPNGTINFPASSQFDLVFDLWIDSNKNGIPDLGEVLTNSVSNYQIDPNLSGGFYCNCNGRELVLDTTGKTEDDLKNECENAGGAWLYHGPIPETYAFRMAQGDLGGVPPPVSTVFQSTGRVLLTDPQIGTNQTGGTGIVNLYQINFDRTLGGGPIAALDPTLSNTLTVSVIVPEPSTLVISSMLLGMFAVVGLRKRLKNPTVAT